MSKGVEINGCIFSETGDVDHDQFLDKFIEFIESNGWYFGGGTKEINEYEDE